MNPMIDVWILFASYFMSVISLAISLFCLVKLTEIVELLQRNKPNQPKYEVKVQKPTKAKPHNWK